MSNITNYLNKVKTAIYGKEVRGAIHDAIKQVYDDASVEHDNANMEVKLARGTHNTLNDRLDNVDEIQAQTNAQLSQIANQTVNYYINNSDELKLDVNVITSGFYDVNDAPYCLYRVESVLGSEIYINIGNGVLIDDNCSIRCGDKKLVLIPKNDEVNIRWLGAVENDKTIANEIVINCIFKKFTTAYVDGSYYIKGSIIHGDNSKLKGRNKYVSKLTLADNVNQYPIKSPKYNFNEFIMLHKEFTLEDICIDGSYKTNGKRNLTGNVMTGYYGAGTCLCNVENLRVNRVKIQNTEAWGYSFFLCKNLNVDDLEFEQKVGNGTNKDGISGSCENAYVKNVYGYTDDDLVAFTTGRGSIGGVTTGVEYNINQKNIIVDNVRGIDKNGVSPWCGVGIYGTQTSIKNVKISNVVGNYELYAFRIGDYWYDSGSGHSLTIENMTIEKCSVSATRSDRVFYIIDCLIDKIAISNLRVIDTNINKAKAMIDFKNCRVGIFALEKSVVIANSSDTNKYYLAQQSIGKGGDIKIAIFDGIETNSYNTSILTNTKLCHFNNCQHITIENFKPINPSAAFYEEIFMIKDVEYSLSGAFSIKNAFVPNSDDITVNRMYQEFVNGFLYVHFDLSVNYTNYKSGDVPLLKPSDMLSRLKFYADANSYTPRLSGSSINCAYYFDKNTKIIRMLNPSLNNEAFDNNIRAVGTITIPTIFI